MKKHRIPTARAPVLQSSRRAGGRSSPGLTLPSGVVLRLGDFRLMARRKARQREQDLAARTPAERERLQRGNSLILLDDVPIEVKEKILPPFC